MGEIFKLFGTIGVDTKDADKGIDGITGKAQSAGGKIAGFFKKAAIAIGSAFAALKVVQFGKMAVEAAASAQAIQAQFDQVFGNLGTNAQKKVEELGKQFGMLPNRLKQPFTATTSMFMGLGLSTEEAMLKAETAVTAAADAAAFYDVSYESANASLTSFLKGNYEAGESIGIFANDTQMAQHAISQGIVGSTAEWQKLDEATKQATRLDYATNMQEMAGATGQAARESEEYENQMGNLKQAWQDFLAIVGGPILEPVVAGLMKVSDWLSTAGEKVVELQTWFSNFKTEVAESTAWNTLKEVMQPVVDLFNSWKDSMSNSTFLDDLKISLTELKDKILEIDFVKLKDDLQAFVDKWLPLIAGIGGATAAYGIYTTALGLKSAAETIAIASMYGMDVAAKILGGTMAFLTSPVTLVIAAIGALIAIGVLLWRNWDTIKAKAIELKDNVTAKFNEMKTAVVNKVNEIKTNAINKFNELKNGISEKTSSAVNLVKTKFSEIYNNIMDPVNRAKDAVKVAIDKIKDFFNFEWSLPKLKMPKISTSGKFSLAPPSVPKFDIAWNKDGGIFSKATLFNTANAGLQGVGEAGPEAIMPLNRGTLGGIGKGVADNMPTLDLNELLQMSAETNALLSQMLLAIESGSNVYVDGRQLSRALAPSMDHEFGKRTRDARRGKGMMF